MVATVRSLAEDQENLPGLLDDAKLEGAAKWAAGAFGLLSALLGFFGVKEGVLDRLLRGYAPRVVYVFVLLGIGVVAALLGPAFRAERQVPVWWVCVAVDALGLGAFGMALGTERDGRLAAFGAVAFFLVLIAAYRLRDMLMSVVGAVVTIAVISTGMGLYGATTLAVETKAGSDEPRVTATLADSVLTVTVTAGNVDQGRLRLFVRGGEGGTRPVELFEQALVPNGVGDVDATVKVPVVPSRWDLLLVSYCAANLNGRCDEDEVEVVRLAPEHGDVRVGANVALGTKPGEYVVTTRATNLAPDVAVDVTIAGTRAKKPLRLSARLVPGDDGVATWTTTLPGLVSGDTVEVTYALCSPACGTTRTTVLSQVVP